MNAPAYVKLLLYIAIAVLPIWIDFFKVSTDYSFRGLMMPILSSLLTAATIARAFVDKGTNPTP